MNLIKYPTFDAWPVLLKRPELDTRELGDTVASILDDVRRNGDEALRRYSSQFDEVELESLLVAEDEFASAELSVSDELKIALSVARTNIEKFHKVLAIDGKPVETTEGVFCWKEPRPIEKVGLYVPAGTAPLFSTVLMLAIPAALAGCREIVMCTPPSADGSINPVSLYAAQLCGVTRVYKLGGAQAIAAMAFGTESVPKVFKIFGPGNQFVTEAKLQVIRWGTAIDMPAGPSEVAILADETCVPAFVAADLLSQAEHGTDSQVLLVTNSESTAINVLAEIDRQIPSLLRRSIAKAALENSKAIVVDSLETGVSLLNEYAPEHLIIATKNASEVAGSITNAGSVFIGNFSCESAGDYASGTNHTLPTNGASKAYSGVSVESFTKTITFQRLTEDGLKNLAPVVETMAAAEGLDGHRRAMSVRRKYLGGDDGV